MWPAEWRTWQHLVKTVYLKRLCRTIGYGSQNAYMYVSNSVVWYSRLLTIWHRNTSWTAASRCPTRHVELVSGPHLTICWTSREHGLNSENVLSPLLDLWRGTHCRQHKSGSICGPWTRSSGYPRHTCFKYRSRRTVTLVFSTPFNSLLFHTFPLRVPGAIVFILVYLTATYRMSYYYYTISWP